MGWLTAFLVLPSRRFGARLFSFLFSSFLSSSHSLHAALDCFALQLHRYTQAHTSVDF